jgi:hypothetical protein
MNLLPEWLRAATGSEIEKALYYAKRRDKEVKRWRSRRPIGFGRRYRRKTLTLLAVVTFLGIAYLVNPPAPSPWSQDMTRRHHEARRNCNAARAVGLAPARRDEPGYWNHLDADNDGISCEPWQPWDR